MCDNNKNIFFKTFLYTYITILIYVATAAFVYYLIPNPILKALISNYIVEPLPYLGAGMICYYCCKLANRTNTLSAITLILLGAIVPILPYNIPVILDNNMIILRFFLRAHIVFTVIGGFFLLHSFKRWRCHDL